MEEKKDSCCSTSSGCCGMKKFIVGLLIGAFIFAAGMWYANSHCPMSGKICPMGSGMPMAK
jgi:hypothetical protein